VDLVRDTSRRLSADLRDMGRDLGREFRDMGREIRDIHREIGQRIRSSSLHNIPRIEISRLGIPSFHDRDSDSDELIQSVGNSMNYFWLFPVCCVVVKFSIDTWNRFSFGLK